MYAMCALGFDNYVDPLTLYLHKYRETTKTDRANINGNDTNASLEESSASDFSELLFNISMVFDHLIERWFFRFNFRSK